MLLGGAEETVPMESSAGAGDAEKVVQLVSMGFPEEEAKQALEAMGGNVENAMAMLLGD